MEKVLNLSFLSKIFEKSGTKAASAVLVPDKYEINFIVRLLSSGLN